MKNYIHTILTIALALVLLLSVNKCSNMQSLNNANLDALTDTVRHYKNALGTITTEKKTLQLSNSQLQRYVIDKDAQLKKLAKEFTEVKSVVKYKTITKIDSIPVPYEVPAPCDFERSGSVKNDWYRFTYTSNQNGFTIDSLNIPNTTFVLTGTKRKWFLGKQTITTDVTHTNPYIATTDLQAAELTIQIPWYKKWWVWAIAGMAEGFYIAK